MIGNNDKRGCAGGRWRFGPQSVPKTIFWIAQDCHLKHFSLMDTDQQIEQTP